MNTIICIKTPKHCILQKITELAAALEYVKHRIIQCYKSEQRIKAQRSTTQSKLYILFFNKNLYFWRQKRTQTHAQK